MAAYDFPVKYFEDNLIYNSSKKYCWAVFKVHGFTYDFSSDERKIKRLRDVARFVANIGVDAKILLVPVAQDIDTYQNELIEKLNKDDVLYDAAKAHALGTGAYLDERLKWDGASNDYVIYVITKLKRERPFSKMMEDMFKKPIRTINEFFEVERAEIFESEQKAFIELSEIYFKEQTKRLRLEKVSAETTEWLIRRMFKRGLNTTIKLQGDKKWKPGKETVIKDGEKAIRPEERDVLTLTEAKIEPSHKTVKISNSDGTTSYQAFLAIANIPDGLEFPGSEWLLLLQDYPIASEVCLHINTIEHKESLTRILNKKREIKSQVEHVEENDKVPEELRNAQIDAERLERELKGKRDPLVFTSVSICIAGENEKTVIENAKFIRERYEDMDFRVEYPMTDQLRLFMEFIPGAERYVNDYILKLPPKTVAGSMFPATRILGDNEGPYIGTTGILKKHVFLWLARACQLNRSASAAILGTLGGGKSFLANLLAYLTVLYGGKALIIDPKGDRGKWNETLPELSDHIGITTLTAGEEERGKLDPYLIYKGDMTAANELAIGLLADLFKINPKDNEYTVLLEATEKMKSEEKPCMMRLVDILSTFPEDDELRNTAKSLARRISLLKNAGKASLLFGTGDEAGLSFDKRINIVQIQEINMPKPDTPKDDYTMEETVATVLMAAVAAFAKRFSMSDRNIFKLVVFDESWALNATQIGSKLYNELARMGRSLNAGAIFIGHSVKDLKGEAIKNAITYKFCFQNTDPDEIENVLDFLELEKTDDNRKLVANLRNGECLFRDLDGRVGLLQVDPVFEHIVNAFNTNPTTEVA